MIKYQARLKRGPRGFEIVFPDLPGCGARGVTRAKSLSNARSALSTFLEDSRDPRWMVPSAKTRKGRTFVWIRPDEAVAVPLMIRQARQRVGFTQRQLAERIGITVQQVQKLETPRKSNPTIRILCSISRALDSDLEITLVA